jgi:hypothetical protein
LAKPAENEEFGQKMPGKLVFSPFRPALAGRMPLGLILRSRRHTFPVSEMIEERHNVSCTEVTGMLHPQNLPQWIQQFGLGMGDDQRSLCREHFRRHKLKIGNNHRQKRNQNLTVAGLCYTPFRLPNTC